MQLLAARDFSDSSDSNEGARQTGLAPPSSRLFHHGILARANHGGEPLVRLCRGPVIARAGMDLNFIKGPPSSPWYAQQHRRQNCIVLQGRRLPLAGVAEQSEVQGPLGLGGVLISRSETAMGGVPVGSTGTLLICPGYRKGSRSNHMLKYSQHILIRIRVTGLLLRLAT